MFTNCRALWASVLLASVAVCVPVHADADTALLPATAPTRAEPSETQASLRSPLHLVHANELPALEYPIRMELSVLIKADGSVGEAQIARSSGHPRLDALLVERVLTVARFNPAQRDGQAVDSRRILPITLQTRGAAPDGQPTPPATSLPPAATPSYPDYSPEHTLYAPFPTFLLSYGDYFSLSLRIELDIGHDGTMRVAADQPPYLFDRDAAGIEQGCAALGGHFNLVTTWYPHTGIFVRGAHLQGLSDASGQAIALKQLQPHPLYQDPPRMVWTGPGARQHEFSYVPCVGHALVSEGSRTDHFAPLDARWHIEPPNAPAITLTLDAQTPLLPFVLVRYDNGFMVPAPMRLVMVGIDWPQRKAWLQLQSTLPSEPRVRKVETRAITAPTTVGERMRNRILQEELAQCEQPTQPVEPCARPVWYSKWLAASIRAGAREKRAIPAEAATHRSD